MLKLLITYNNLNFVCAFACIYKNDLEVTKTFKLPFCCSIKSDVRHDERNIYLIKKKCFM